MMSVWPQGGAAAQHAQASACRGTGRRHRCRIRGVLERAAAQEFLLLVHACACPRSRVPKTTLLSPTASTAAASGAAVNQV